MDIRRLSSHISVSAQLNAEDVTRIAELKFRSIMCNRPDGEDPDQPDSQAIRGAAKEAGLNFGYVPVISGMLTSENVVEFTTELGNLDGPVLAYCRTGTRSVCLWALSEPVSCSAASIIETAKRAGYDISTLVSARLASKR